METANIPEEVEGFTDVPDNGLDPCDIKLYNQSILTLEVSDKKQKLIARWVVAGTLMFLLLVQNSFIGYFLHSAYRDNRLSEFATVISIICTATLAETYGIIHTMVRWIFSDMEYKIR
ncbi:MAG: hypothetical protein PHC70_01195 [Patescibacteria group bacterium]|nr:hypothetical protein [Patescibacteria group bacterium]